MSQVDCMCDDIAATVFNNNKRSKFQSNFKGRDMCISPFNAFKFIPSQTTKRCWSPPVYELYTYNQRTNNILDFENMVFTMANTLENSPVEYAFYRLTHVYTTDLEFAHAIVLFGEKKSQTIWLFDPHSDHIRHSIPPEKIQGTEYTLKIPISSLQSQVEKLGIHGKCTNLALLPIWVYVRLSTEFRCSFEAVIKRITNYVNTHSKEQCEQLLRNFAVIVQGRFQMPAPRLPLNNQASPKTRNSKATSAPSKSGKRAGSASTRSSPRT
jgi:hypothetical protein